MNSNELTIEPLIIHGACGCPNCNTILYVGDVERTFIELNREGIPISSETTVSCYGICPKCNFRTPMMRYNGCYVPRNRCTEIWAKVEADRENKERADNVTIKGNPFEKD